MKRSKKKMKEMSSNSEVPKIKLALEDKYKKQDEAKPEPLNPDNIKSQVDQLPEPSGWRLLVLPFTPKEKTKGGIIIAPEALDKFRIRERKFTDPWCKKGDWVIFARYAGSRLPIEGGEVRILNDDEVLGTIANPESLLHVL
jgi:co-chaperonin GroES (HSP10)